MILIDKETYETLSREDLKQRVIDSKSKGTNKNIKVSLPSILTEEAIAEYDVLIIDHPKNEVPAGKIASSIKTVVEAGKPVAKYVLEDAPQRDSLPKTEKVLYELLVLLNSKEKLTGKLKAILELYSKRFNT